MYIKKEVKDLITKFEDIKYPDGYKGMTRYEAVYCALITAKTVLKNLSEYIVDDEIGMGRTDNPAILRWKKIKKKLKKEFKKESHGL